jgi:hypothetical protein
MDDIGPGNYFDDLSLAAGEQLVHIAAAQD